MLKNIIGGAIAGGVMALLLVGGQAKIVTVDVPKLWGQSTFIQEKSKETQTFIKKNMEGEQNQETMKMNREVAKKAQKTVDDKIEKAIKSVAKGKIVVDKRMILSDTKSSERVRDITNAIIQRIDKE